MEARVRPFSMAKEDAAFIAFRCNLEGGHYRQWPVLSHSLSTPLVHCVPLLFILCKFTH